MIFLPRSWKENRSPVSGRDMTWLVAVEDGLRNWLPLGGEFVLQAEIAAQVGLFGRSGGRFSVQRRLVRWRRHYCCFTGCCLQRRAAVSRLVFQIKNQVRDGLEVKGVAVRGHGDQPLGNGSSAFERQVAFVLEIHLELPLSFCAVLVATDWLAAKL